jgi:hypothetical protein
MPGVDGDFLPFAGFHLVYVGDGNADGSEDVGGGLADPEPRGKNWVASRNGHFSLGRHAAAADGHQLFECSVHLFLVWIGWRMPF